MNDLIYAIDEDDSTYYVLCRDGHLVASCGWPQPLEAAYPGARRAGTFGGSPWHVSHPGPDSDVYGNLHKHDPGRRLSLYGDLVESLVRVIATRQAQDDD